MKLASILIGGGLALFVIPQTTAAESIACRDRVARESVRYASLVLRKVEDCHQGQLRGKLPASHECADPSQWDGTEFAGAARSLDVQAARLVRAIAASCTPSSPDDDIGFTTCPAPCGAEIDGVGDVGDCSLCLARHCATSVMASIYGASQGGSGTRSVTRCYRRIGGAARKYFHKRQQLILECETNRREGREGFDGVDCAGLSGASHPYRATVDRLLERLVRSLQACTTRDAVDLGADMDSCGTDVASEAACVAASVDTCLNGMLGSVYATPTPVPTETPTSTNTPTLTPTSTSTETPTPTPTPTPSCAPTGTPYCSKTTCQPCAEIRPGCYAHACGLCVEYGIPCQPGAAREDFCVSQPYATCSNCPCVTFTPTRTGTPTRTPSPVVTSTPVDCGASAPQPNPLPSVTDELLLEITGSVFVHGPYSVIEACSEAGCTTTNLPTAHPQTHGFTAAVELQPETLNHISICTKNPICSDVACAAVREVVHSSGM